MFSGSYIDIYFVFLFIHISDRNEKEHINRLIATYHVSQAILIHCN